jgi:hypothetical protein
VTPTGRALDTDLLDTMRAQQLDRFEVAASAVGEAGMGDLHTVAIDHGNGEARLVRVDPRHG